MWHNETTPYAAPPLHHDRSHLRHVQKPRPPIRRKLPKRLESETNRSVHVINVAVISESLKKIHLYIKPIGHTDNVAKIHLAEVGRGPHGPAVATS